MKEILTVNPNVPLYSRDIRVVEWTHGDPFPDMGPSVGVDTETELITDSVLFPPVVVLGCFDGENQICYIVHWQDIPEFMHHLCVREIEQRYFNLGFDEGVIDNEDDCKILLEAIDAGRVRDMQIRIHLNDIATKGWIPPEDYSLKGCSMAYLGLELDKGDGTENSARLSFRRDRQITEEQYRYLPFDCIATWMLGELKKEKLVESVEDARLVREAPVDKNTGRSIEIVHTQGMVALAHIRANGFPVDMRIFDALEAELKADYADAKKVIVDMGFPDPDYDPKEEKAQMELKYVDNMRMFLGDTANFSVPSKMDIRQMIAVLYSVDGVEDSEQIFQALNLVREAALDGVKSLRKGKKGEKGPSKWWDEAAEKFGLIAFTNSGRPIVMLAFITKLVELLSSQRWAAGFKSFNMSRALEETCAYMDEQKQWSDNIEVKGPRKFFQEQVQRLVAAHPSLKLSTTEKSGEIQLTKKDMWRLEDAGIDDPFIKAYTRIGHITKYLSTYLNRDFIAGDGKVHARFTSLVRTGRTSCVSPNLQNYPSHDKEYAPKNYFCAPPGTILCATDYSFVELVNLAESCIQRFGYSSMGDVINAGVDPHRWFAGVREGRITNDTSFIDDPEQVAALKEKLKKEITPESRQASKASNFGFPGGMKESLFRINCRENGMQMSEKHAKELRDAWLEAFPEMKEHFAIKPENHEKEIKIQLGAKADKNTKAAAEQGKDPESGTYKAVLTNGMIRANCSYNSALNIQFQGLASYGGKCGLWNLMMAGFGDRMLNFIHDEVLYWLWPWELDILIPVVEKCMIDGMRVATPHVRVGVETCCMLHWDKHAEEFIKLKKDDNGNYIIPEPPYVKEVLGLGA